MEISFNLYDIKDMPLGHRAVSKYYALLQINPKLPKLLTNSSGGCIVRECELLQAFDQIGLEKHSTRVHPSVTIDYNLKDSPFLFSFDMESIKLTKEGNVYIVSLTVTEVTDRRELSMGDYLTEIYLNTRPGPGVSKDKIYSIHLYAYPVFDDRWDLNIND